MSVRVINGDCRVVLSTLNADSFDCIVTSPPYWGLRDYGVDGQIGLEPTLDGYVEELCAVFDGLWRVLKPTGTAWLNLGDSYAGSWGAQSRENAPIDSMSSSQIVAHPKTTRTGSLDKYQGLKPKDLIGVPWRVAFALQARGWWLRSAIVWAKPNPMPESVTDRPTSAYEMVFLLTKAERYFYDASAIAEPAIYHGLVGQDESGFKNPMNFNGKHAANPEIRGERKSDKQRGHGRRHAGFNDRWDAMEKAEQCAGMRNARNVWTIATTPFKGSHFATMPPDLAERCIKAGSSERGCCPHCGKGWERIVGEPIVMGRRDNGGEFGGADASMYAGRAGSSSRPFLGWRPTCECPPHEPIPARILDPFGGAGTTGLVADRLGRNATLIELNPAYRDMGMDRIRDDSPLFVEVS